jgi:hypothetical protein
MMILPGFALPEEKTLPAIDRRRDYREDPISTAEKRE